jgi:hypothetical protein
MITFFSRGGRFARAKRVLLRALRAEAGRADADVRRRRTRAPPGRMPPPSRLASRPGPAGPRPGPPGEGGHESGARPSTCRRGCCRSLIRPWHPCPMAPLRVHFALGSWHQSPARTPKCAAEETGRFSREFARRDGPRSSETERPSCVTPRPVGRSVTNRKRSSGHSLPRRLRSFSSPGGHPQCLAEPATVGQRSRPFTKPSLSSSRSG